jgi:nucleotide-binding universal stress UspA family protein
MTNTIQTEKGKDYTCSYPKTKYIMPTIKKILFPTDFSKMSMQGYLYCLNIAKLFEASIDVVHIYRTDLNIPTTSEFGLKMMEQRKQNIALELGKFTNLQENKEQQNLLNGVTLKMHTYLGLPEDGIADYATKNDIDLIVMPTKGEHNFVEVLFGSNTVATIAKATCPVFVVPENCTYKPIKNIAYTTNLSYENTDNIELPLELAKTYKATLNYLYVYNNKPAPDWKIDELMMKNYEGIDASFHQIKNEQIEQGVDDFLEQKEMDLLVTYSPQKSFFERFFHLSTTRHIIEHIKTPMLVLK